MTTNADDERVRRSNLRDLLHEAKRDLDNSGWPGLMGCLLNPVKDSIILPSLHLLESTLPQLTRKVPLVDAVASLAVGAASGTIKFAYGILPHEPSLRELAQLEVRKDALQTLQLSTLPERWGAQDAIALLTSGLGFAANLLLDITTDPGRKFRNFVETMEIFIAYILHTGIDEEIAEAFASPRIFTNIATVAHIQAKFRQDRRRETAFINNPIKHPSTRDALLKDAQRFLDFSTAAYGVWQIKASAIARPSNVFVLSAVSDKVRSLQQFIASLIHKYRLQRIGKYLGISESDILYLTPPGGGPVIRHLIAVDHTTKSIVLALRGTYSASDLIVDIEATTVTFCGGIAHKGMAERALCLLRSEPTMSALARGLSMNPGYRPIVTGHSLGAGIASLMGVKLNFDAHPISSDLQVFGYACPPVYGSPTDCPTLMQAPAFNRVQHAIANTVCFIGGEDVVPFLSIDAVRRLSDVLYKVDEITETMNPWDKVLLARGLKEPPEQILEIVKDGSKDLEPLPGAERLKIPALFVPWMDDSEEEGSTDVAFCRPGKISNLSILLANEFVLDHWPPRYEERFVELLGTGEVDDMSDITYHSITS